MDHGARGLRAPPRQGRRRRLVKSLTRRSLDEAKTESNRTRGMYLLLMAPP